jgi:hypothetical protein
MKPTCARGAWSAAGPPGARWNAAGAGHSHHRRPSPAGWSRGPRPGWPWAPRWCWPPRRSRPQARNGTAMKPRRSPRMAGCARRAPPWRPWWRRKRPGGTRGASISAGPGVALRCTLRLCARAAAGALGGLARAHLAALLALGAACGSGRGGEGGNGGQGAVHAAGESIDSRTAGPAGARLHGADASNTDNDGTGQTNRARGRLPRPA